MSLLPAKYSLDNLRTALDNPRMFLGELNHLGNRLNVAVHRRRYDGVGMDVFEEEWDTLLILDACRYDVYAERTTVEGDLQSRISPGSESWEFMQACFAGDTHHDTVYVTANPHAFKLEPGTFHATRNLLDDRWDPETKTVLPEDVADAAREAREEYPNKRLVVHFMQPHFPFIGETGRQLDHGGIVYHLDGETATDDPGDEMMIWGQLRWGLIDRDPVWEAYVENLDIVLDTVEDLLADLDGQTVITADHGNLFGERLRPVPTRTYGHPPGVFAPELRRVPWHVVPGERRRVTAEPPEGRDTLDDDLAQRRLRDLGYVE